MMRAGMARDKAILVVEGPTDLRLMERFVDETVCAALCSFGKDNALGAVALLLAEGTPGIVGFVDADFGRIDGDLPSGPSVVVSDHHDAEMMLLSSRALEKVLAEYGCDRKQPEFRRRMKVDSIRTHIFTESAKLGRLRHRSKEAKWRLKFRGIRHKKFVDAKTTLRVDLAAAVQVVLANSSGVTVSSEAVLAATPGDSDYPLTELCSGHDCTALLALGLSQCLGSLPPQLASRENVEKLLRLAYEEEDWRRTTAREAFRAWEVANAPFRVLKVLPRHRGAGEVER